MLKELARQTRNNMYNTDYLKRHLKDSTILNYKFDLRYAVV